MAVITRTGTTGKPKGVDVAHLGVCNTLSIGPSNLGITVGTKVGQVLSVSFDMGLSPRTDISRKDELTMASGAWEILGSLMNGGTLYLRNSNWEETLKQVRSRLLPFRHVFLTHLKVEVLIATPSILGRFKSAEFPNIKAIAVGGEPCPRW
jgi:hypothetical protein